MNYKKKLKERYKKTCKLIELDRKYLEDFGDMLTEDAKVVMQAEIDLLIMQKIDIEDEAKKAGVIL